MATSPFDWKNDSTPSILAGDPEAKPGKRGLTPAQNRSLAVKKFERERGYNPGSIPGGLKPKPSTGRKRKGRDAGQ